MVLARTDFLSEYDFPLIETGESRTDNAIKASPVDINGDIPLEKVEKATILRTLEATAGNKSEAARRLGITRKTLHKKLKSYGVMP